MVQDTWVGSENIGRSMMGTVYFNASIRPHVSISGGKMIWVMRGSPRQEVFHMWVLLLIILNVRVEQILSECCYV